MTALFLETTDSSRGREGAKRMAEKNREKTPDSTSVVLACSWQMAQGGVPAGYSSSAARGNRSRTVLQPDADMYRYFFCAPLLCFVHSIKCCIRRTAHVCVCARVCVLSSYLFWRPVYTFRKMQAHQPESFTQLMSYLKSPIKEESNIH